MLLVQALAIVGVLAQANLVTAAEPGLEGPVGVGQGLAGGADDVAVAGSQHVLGGLEVVHAAGAHHGRVQAGLEYGPADAGGGLAVAAEGAARVGQVGRHALVAAAAGVGVGGLADAGLPGIVELAAAAGGQEVHARARELHTEPHGVVDAAAAVDALVGQEATTDGPVRADLGPHRGIHLQRQPDPRLARAAPAIVPAVGG